MNLHAIVRGAINANNPDAAFTLYRYAGDQFSKGVKTALYEKVEGLSGNFQSEGDAALSFQNLAGQNTITRKLYLCAPADEASRPWAVYRPLGRGGDYVADATGRWWKVDAVEEDFSADGWECLRVVLQNEAPAIQLKGA